MAGITVSKGDLEGILQTEITDETFESVHTHTLRMIRSGTRRDLDILEGRPLEVVDGVYVSIAVRLLTNPVGASLLGVGGAQVSFGGASEALSLTEGERRELASINPRRKPSSLRHSSPYAPVMLPGFEGA